MVVTPFINAFQQPTEQKTNMMLLCQHSISTKNIFKCDIITSFAEQFLSLVGGNVDLVDSIATTAVIVFIVEIDYELNNVTVTAISTRIEIHNAIEYNCDLMDRIILESHVCGIFNDITLIATGKLIEVVSLSLLLHTLSIIFDEFILHLYKLSTIECVYGNNGNVTIIINNFYKISDTVIVVGVFITVIYFVSEGIDGSSNIILSTQFDASIAQLILYSTAQSSISAIYCHTEVIVSVLLLYIF